MTTLSLGNHSKITALASQRDRIREFYRDVLGCEATKQTDQVDFFRMGADFFTAILYGESVSSDTDLQKSIWLELRTDDPTGLSQRILDFGVRQLDVFDKSHLYFQAPGGQVYRVVGSNEDLSRFEK